MFGEGGILARTRIAAPQGGVRVARGVGGGGCSGEAMLRRIFEVFEFMWETSDDDRAKLEGSQRVATSSPFDISRGWWE